MGKTKVLTLILMVVPLVVRADAGKITKLLRLAAKPFIFQSVVLHLLCILPCSSEDNPIPTSPNSPAK